MDIPKPRALPYAIDSDVRYGGSTWKVAAVMFTGGERYYFLTRDNCTAMLPWFSVELDPQQSH